MDEESNVSWDQLRSAIMRYRSERMKPMKKQIDLESFNDLCVNKEDVKNVYSMAKMGLIHPKYFTMMMACCVFPAFKTEMQVIVYEYSVRALLKPIVIKRAKYSYEVTFSCKSLKTNGKYTGGCWFNGKNKFTLSRSTWERELD